MIKLVPDPTFDTDVLLTVPGKPEPVVVPMTFRYMTTEQASAWFRENGPKPSTESLPTLVLNWNPECVLDEDGTPLKFSKEALVTLIRNYAPSTSEILRAWQLGLTESRIKN